MQQTASNGFRQFPILCCVIFGAGAGGAVSGVGAIFRRWPAAWTSHALLGSKLPQQRFACILQCDLGSVGKASR